MPPPVTTLRRYLIAGLLVWLPLGVTVLVVKILVDLMDRSLLLLPPDYRPDALLGFHIPGLGVVISVAAVLLTGMLVANLLGRRLVALWENLLTHIPLVRSVYSGAKQVAETLFAEDGQSFRKVLLVQYPRLGIWSIAFLTGTATEEVNTRSGRDLLTVFVPTTPNPTSGFIILVPREEVQELEMSVDDALKLIISLGVVKPGGRRPADAIAPPAGSA